MRKQPINLLTLIFALLLRWLIPLPFALTAEGPLIQWHRVSPARILSPQGDGWESAGTFNPAVVVHDGTFVLLYCAQDTAGASRLGYAASNEDINSLRRSQLVLAL